MAMEREYFIAAGELASGLMRNGSVWRMHASRSARATRLHFQQSDRAGHQPVRDHQRVGRNSHDRWLTIASFL